MPYGSLCDAYSAGVVFLELFQGKKLPAAKDKQAQKIVAELRAKLPLKKPVGQLIYCLTAAEPSERASCRKVLDTNKLMQRKFGGAPPVRLVNFKHAHVSFAYMRCNSYWFLSLVFFSDNNLGTFMSIESGEQKEDSKRILDVV